MNNPILEAFMRDPEILEAVKDWAKTQQMWKDSDSVRGVNSAALIDRLLYLLQRQEIVSVGSYMDTPLFVHAGD